MEVTICYRKLCHQFLCADAIRDLNSKLLEAGHRVSELEDTVKTLTEEIENVKMIAAVSENTKEVSF